MSWFNYGNLNSSREHAKRYGVWIRRYSNPDVDKLIKKSKLKRPLETVQRVVVKEYNELNNTVFLEVWCRNLYRWKRLRYNVFYIKVTPNPMWVCEGDLGVGYIE